MLVLSRKPGERVIIRQNIVVTVVRIDGNRAILGFDAPPDVPIERPEHLDKVNARKEADK
jgi:carbon storage regulator